MAVQSVKSSRAVAPSTSKYSDGQKEAAAWAKSLGMGKLKSSQGAAGTMYYEFAKGTISWSNVEQKMRSVAFKGKNEMYAGELPVAAARAAVRLGLGKFKMHQGAMGSSYYEFERGTVRWSNINDKLGDVTLGPAGSGGPSIDAKVVSAALKHHLGAFLSESSASGVSRYGFKGGTIQYNQRTGALKILEKSAT